MFSEKYIIGLQNLGSKNLFDVFPISYQELCVPCWLTAFVVSGLGLIQLQSAIKKLFMSKNTLCFWHSGST